MIEDAGSGSATAGESSRQPLAASRSQAPQALFCNVCSHQCSDGAADRRFRSIDELIRVTGMRRDEVTVLAEIGALNSLGYDRRSALWQVERLVRPAGALFAGEGLGEEPWQGEEQRLAASGLGLEHTEHDVAAGETAGSETAGGVTAVSEIAGEPSRQPLAASRFESPLPEMSAGERLVADYAGTGITVGPHPMSFRRHELATKGVLRAIDLPQVRNGRRVRTAGMVITRQRPGTAKGFVFLTLEDETGVANIIVRPDVYARDRAIVVDSPFLLVEGILQVQDGVTAIKAERMERLEGLLASMAVESHDFH